jgi:hypothetical protein
MLPDCDNSAAFVFAELPSGHISTNQALPMGNTDAVPLAGTGYPRATMARGGADDMSIAAIPNDPCYRPGR